MEKHRVFICYHHANDQWYKEQLSNFGLLNDIFIDYSVSIGDIDDTNLDDQSIRRMIRDDYLKDSSVTILLVGTETKYRKHIDWELYSSMYDGVRNKKSGILVIQLPTINNTNIRAAHGDKEKKYLYPNITNWISCTKEEIKERYPSMPERIIDNLVASNVSISVVNWNDMIADPNKLKLLIDLTFEDRQTCEYDLSRPMKKYNETV